MMQHLLFQAKLEDRYNFPEYQETYWITRLLGDQFRPLLPIPRNHALILPSEFHRHHHQL